MPGFFFESSWSICSSITSRSLERLKLESDVGYLKDWSHAAAVTLLPCSCIIESDDVAALNDSSRFVRDAGGRRVDRRRFRAVFDGRGDDDDVGVGVGPRAEVPNDVSVADVRCKETEKR